MGMTIVEKILARASGKSSVKPGDILPVDVDTAVLLDSSFFFQILSDRQILSVADPDKVVVIYDHEVPAPQVGNAKAQTYGRSFVKRFGIKRFHDVGRDHGISHVVVAERGYARPGTLLVCGDSHTCSAGAFNCAARGIGSPDMVYAVTTGQTWFELGGTVRYDLEGQLPHGSSAKDVFLYIAGTFGSHAGLNVEYGGSALPHLNMNARRTISTMSAELSAEFATFEADQLLLDYLKERDCTDFTPVAPDPDAQYVRRTVIDLSKIGAMVGMPDAVINNVCEIDKIDNQQINQAFIGSCANGTLDDIEVAARVVKGRRVAPGVRLIVTPGSQDIFRRAIEAGFVSTLMEAGAVVTQSTCGACHGSHTGVIGPGEICITASTRNFKGRMGDPSAKIYMASPATVAASAIAGVITSPAKMRAL